MPAAVLAMTWTTTFFMVIILIISILEPSLAGNRSLLNSNWRPECGLDTGEYAWTYPHFILPIFRYLLKDWNRCWEKLKWAWIFIWILFLTWWRPLYVYKPKSGAMLAHGLLLLQPPSWRKPPGNRHFQAQLLIGFCLLHTLSVPTFCKRLKSDKR